MTKFEERLWSLIRNFVELGHNNPAMLVAAVRIVEIQEMDDKQLESSSGGSFAELSHHHFCLQLSEHCACFLRIQACLIMLLLHCPVLLIQTYA